MNKIANPLDSASRSRRTVLRGVATVAVAGSAIGALSGCSSSDSSSGSPAVAGSALDAIKKRGKLNILTQLQYKPEAYLDNDGKPAGYHVEVAKLMCKDLGVEPNFINLSSFTSLIPGLQAGKGDAIIVGTTATPERALVVDFARGNSVYTLQILVPTNTNVSRIEDLNASNRTISVLSGSDAYFRAQALFPNAKLVQLDQQPALLAVATGKSDACVVENTTASQFLPSHSNVKVLPGAEDVGLESGSIAVQKGQFEWLQWINTWIAYYIDNRTLPLLWEKIMGVPWNTPGI